MSKTFEDLEVWRKAHAWVLNVYRFTENFPRHELFGLVSQESRRLEAYVRAILSTNATC